MKKHHAVLWFLAGWFFSLIFGPSVLLGFVRGVGGKVG